MPDPPENETKRPVEGENKTGERNGEGLRQDFQTSLEGQKGRLNPQEQQKGAADKLPATEIVGKENKPWSLSSLETAVDYLERTKPLAERSMQVKSAGDRAQRNLYELLSKQLLPELKKQGKIGAEWQVYPSVAQSPADKVGADFLLVNTKTGAFHFVDSTMKESKDNVFSLRSDGVVVVDNRLFDAMQALKTDEGGDIGRDAIKFKSDLSAKIESLTKTSTPFRLGPEGTPMPSLTSKSAEQTTAEIDRLSGWAKEQARKGGSNAAAFEEMSRVVSRASVHTSVSQVEVFSPKFAETVQRQTEAEIVRYVFSKYKNENYQQASGNDTGILKMLKDGKVKMSTADGERLDGGAMQDHLDKGWQALIRDQKKLLSSLSNKDLQSMGADITSFAKLKGNDRAEAIDKAYKSQPKFRQAADNLRGKLHELKSHILAGGAVGSNKPVIVDNVVTKLKGRNEQALLGIEAKPEPKPAEIIAPAEQLRRSTPKAAEELASFHRGEKFTDGKFSPSVAETMELMILEQQGQETWPKGELAKFSKLHEAYIDPKNPGHSEAVKQVHDYLSKDPSNDNAADRGISVVELESKLKGEPAFQKLTDQNRMAEALKQLSDRALQRMPSGNNEAAEFLTGQLKAAMRKQLGLNTDAELPAVLRELQVKVVDSDARSVSVKTGASGTQVLEIPAKLLKSNPKGVIVDSYTQAAGLSILNMLNEKSNSEAGMSSLRPVLEKIAGQAEKVVGARSIALAQRTPAMAIEQASSDRRVVLEAGKPVLTSWDGTSLSFGGEKFHMSTELDKIAKDRETRISELEKDFKKASELAEKSKTAKDIAGAKALEAQLAAERQDLRVVFELQASLKGQRGEQAQARVGEMFKSAADRAITEHFQSRAESPGQARSSAVMSRGAALAMVLTTLSSMYFAGAKPAQAQTYESGFR